MTSEGGFNDTGMLWYPERDSHWARGTTLFNLVDAYQAAIDGSNTSLASPRLFPAEKKIVWKRSRTRRCGPQVYWYKARLPKEGFSTLWPTDLCHSNFIGLLLRQAAEKEGGVKWQPSVL